MDKTSLMQGELNRVLVEEKEAWKTLQETIKKRTECEKHLRKIKNKELSKKLKKGIKKMEKAGIKVCSVKMPAQKIVEDFNEVLFSEIIKKLYEDFTDLCPICFLYRALFNKCRKRGSALYGKHCNPP